MNFRPHHSSADKEPSPLDWAWEKGLGEEIVHRTRARVRRRRQRALGAAAAVAAILVVVGILLRSKSDSIAITGSPSTVVTVPARQVLPDGSIVDLRGDAQIASDFSGPSRNVTLIRGEAHFQVVHDERRPFLVIAHGVEIRDVGTTFSVSVRPTTVEVLVSEGRVALAPTAGRPEADAFTTIVAAGNRAVVSVPAAGTAPGELSTPQVSPVSERDMTEIDSWRIPRLEFVGTPLAEVVTTFNRYASLRHGTQIVLTDPSLERLQLSGILRVDNSETLLQVLDANFGIKADPEVDRKIRLHAQR